MRPNSAVLIQKPMGRDLADARRILAQCRERQLIAAMNFQLRFAPNMLALRDAIGRGLVGEFTDLEVRIMLHTPWNYWAFLKGEPRLEILMHSIHYLDLVRSMLGERAGSTARACSIRNCRTTQTRVHRLFLTTGTAFARASR